MRWLALLVMSLALVAAGCGGSDDESAASDETAIEETTTTETTSEGTTTEETTDTTDVDVSGILGDEDCLRLAGIGATFAQALTGASDEEATEAFQKLVDEVPEEIKADVQVLADWLADYTAKLQDIGLTTGQVPTAEQLAQLQTALADTNQDEVTAASQRLEAWAKDNCNAVGG